MEICNNYFTLHARNLPLQKVPFPLKPSMHVHMKLPSVSSQVALLILWQSSVPSKHSSISNRFINSVTLEKQIWFKNLLLQTVPLPLYPVLHVQLKLPSVFEQVAFKLQLCRYSGSSVVHSSISIIQYQIIISHFNTQKCT